MPLTAVFLDLGNTLLMEQRSRSGLYAEEARHTGLAITEPEMQACMARAHARLPREVDGAFRYSDGWFRAFQRHIFVQELGLDPRNFSELSERLFARFEDPDSFLLYPGARELLLTLRQRGLAVGLISNWSARLARLLDVLALTASFDFVLGSADLRLEKPDPAIFRKALERAGVPPRLCLHAGDDVECDARGALGVGISPVLVDHRGQLGPAERALCPVVGSLGELQELILEQVQ